MPYIETLKTLQTGNTATGIFETMALLLNLTGATHRVSFIRDRRNTRLSVGDTLELASQTGGKPRKRRWWEQEGGQGEETRQLRLPFSLYEPAKILSVSYDNSLRQVRLRLVFVGEGGEEKSIFFCHTGSRFVDFTLKAIRVHEVVKKWVEPGGEAAASPFLDSHSLTQTLSSGHQYSLSQRDCEELAERAMVEHGLAVTASNKVYDNVTGECVGTDFTRLAGGIRNHSGEPLEACKMRLRDGTEKTFYIESRRLRRLNSERPTGEECGRMLTQAVRRGMVVTSRGDAYDKVSGELIGNDVRLTTSRQPVLRERGEFGLLPPSSVSGDVRLLNGQIHCFMIESDMLDYAGSANYSAPTQPRSR